jgi:hypothetical protein
MARVSGGNAREQLVGQIEIRVVERIVARVRASVAACIEVLGEIDPVSPQYLRAHVSSIPDG